MPAAEAVHRLNTALAALRCEARSQSGLVAATVGVRHDLRSLWIDPHVYRLRDADAFMGDVKEAVHSACARVDREARVLAENAGVARAADDDLDLAYEPLLRGLDELTGERRAR